MKRGASLRLGLVALAFFTGCAATPVLTPGLANVPALPDLAVTPEIGVHDAVANGNDSCPRARVAAGDPLRIRYPACPGGEAPRLTSAFASPKAADVESTDELWNIHLHGLPPCESIGEVVASNELVSPVCR